MRYETYITKDTRIFWTKNSTDKPTRDYFNTIVNSANWVKTADIAINWLSQFNASVVLDDNDYTYIKLVDTKKNTTRYYLIDGVEQEGTEGYVVSIVLDVFTTYLYAIYDKLVSYPIQVNRTTAMALYNSSLPSQLLQDELLPLFTDYVRVNPTGPTLNAGEYYYIGKLERPEIYRYNNNTNKYEVIGDLNYNNTEVVYEVPNIDHGGAQKAILFDVFWNPKRKGAIWLIPRITELNYPYFKLVKNNQVILENLFWNTQAELLKNHPDFINQYLGEYYAPLPLELIGKAFKVIPFSGKLTPILIDRNQNINLILQLELFDVLETKEHDYIAANTIDTITTKSTKLNTYVLSKFTQPNSAIPFLHNKKPHIINGNPSYIFNPSSGFNFFNTSKNGAIVWYGIETTPFTKDSYIEYLSGIQSQQNTNMEIARQDATIGSVKNIWSTAFSGITSILTGNILVGLSTAVSGGFNTYDTLRQYENTKKKIDAAHADKKRTSTPNLAATSNISANMYNMKCLEAEQSNNFYSFFSVFLKGLTNPNDLNDANKTTWSSGFKISNNVILEDFNVTNNTSISFYTDNVNSFIYWDIDVNTDYVKLIAPTYDNTILEAIYLLINNPVRFWTKTPNYLEPLHLKQ